MDTTNGSPLIALAEKIKESYSIAEIAQLIRLIEPTPKTRLMSSDDFENLMDLLDATSTRRSYSPKSRDAARLFFVMGANVSEISAETGLTIQAVNQLIIRIRRRMEDMPAGWVSVSAVFPKEVAKQVKLLANELWSAHKSGKALDHSFNIVLTKD
ncbi:hypothetical protein C3E97_030025 [Pseudomonas sp. MWU12-2115]|uniref:TrfB-related DNA-binding protein n=1 Tax=unclassified Pseudomonas TaxID=196821 RepID=UPI000CD57EEA|nr:TrfB-related DNA-binding protein [Pseudomonas sp. MWU12-2020]RBB96765.1 hypothetical protein C3E97_030025 [Pseudomonas sp. MWU12-2115]